ncbi:phosphoglycerate mutase family protein [Jatrophihabitans telluris]|uniref:Phosphoglycerate mutase family protein n=1 Tax=Jatrophihabitans telluris TaxID=2038343 RepID=A0ABY4QXH2_9ACTN|nr:histidine phosphatase family protein [Jatrophihabitans telluris]UQX87711.1 phosphoglycerate mutase family protein [Jatrophihabitans telluris]
MRVYFLTHPEVGLDPELPVPEWGLTERGRERAGLVAGSLSGVGRLVSSPEVKAEQAARIIGRSLRLEVTLVGGLAEIDRSTTGYLPEPEFWANYQDFLARPAVSAKGWETALDAQRRVVATVGDLVTDADADAPGGALVVMSHGGVGALLLAKLSGTPIERLADQPGQGSCFSFDTGPDGLGDAEIRQGWCTFEELAAR